MKNAHGSGNCRVGVLFAASALQLWLMLGGFIAVAIISGRFYQEGHLIRENIGNAMRIEIDQSVKIEQLSRDTILGLSNGVQFTVIIPSKVKRKLQVQFRGQGQPKLFRYRTFMAGVVLLIRHAEIKEGVSIRLDREYSGREPALTSMFYEMWSRFSEDIPPFEISEIGKSSAAHDVCFQVLRKKRKTDKVLTYGDLKKLALK